MKSAGSGQGREAAGGWTLGAGRVVAVLAAVTLCASSALAQDRLPPVPADKLTDAQMGTYLRFGNSLPRDVSEFAILLVSRRWTQQYEWYVHAADGRTAGLSDAIIQAVADGRRPEGLSEGMEIVYDFSNELNDFHSVTDRTYARMVGKYGEQGMMDLVGLNGYYSMISMVLNVGRTTLPPGNSPALKPFPK